jgi:hypothetical protein
MPEAARDRLAPVTDDSETFDILALWDAWDARKAARPPATVPRPGLHRRGGPVAQPPRHHAGLRKSSSRVPPRYCPPRHRGGALG